LADRQVWSVVREDRLVVSGEGGMDDSVRPPVRRGRTATM